MTPEASTRPNLGSAAARTGGSNGGPDPLGPSTRTELDSAREDVAAATRALAGSAAELRELAARARAGGFVGTAVLDGIRRYEVAAASASAAQGRLRVMTSALRLGPRAVPDATAGTPGSGERPAAAPPLPALTTTIDSPPPDEAGVDQAWS